MNDELADVEIVLKPSEDSISTSNPKAKPTCEKKITNVYIAEQKILFVVIEAGDFLGKIAKSYEALTADDITDINKLPNPNQLAIGQEIIISSKVHVVQAGDSLGKIAKMSEYAPVEWEEIAKANQLNNPNNISVGQKLVIPLARSKHAKLCKEIKYVPKVDTSVGDVVHIVTEVTGFKNGESVKNTIKEDKNIVTQAEETLAVVENDKEKKEITSIVKLDEEDPTKGQAISEPLEVKPKLDMLIYEVKQGDVLGKIVKLYEGVTAEDIVTKNKLENENSIYVGQKLIIPTDKMNDVTSTQEVKDELNEEPTKSTEIVPVASSPSLPKDEDVEGETVNLTVEPKIVDVYFGTPVKSSKVKPTTEVVTYSFRSASTTITKDNQKKIITKYIIPRTTKGDKKATYADALKALPSGTYKAKATIKVTLSEPVYTYKKIKSTSLFSTVYLVAEVKDFPDDEKVKLEILEQDGVLASKGTTVQFIDKTKAEVTSVEATVMNEGEKQYAVAKVTLSRTDEEAKKVWKETIEKAKDKKSHLKVKGTSVSGLCGAKKSLKKVELLGGCEVAPWMEIVKEELGINEDDNRTRIEEYVKIAKGGGWINKSEKDFRSSFNVTSGKGAWCSCFASWAIAETNTQKGTDFSRLTGWESVPEGARNWVNMTFPKKTFHPPVKPPYGTILIMKHTSKTDGHATFITNYEHNVSWENITTKNKEGKKSIKKVKVDEIKIVAVGGNQDDKVQYTTYTFKKNSKGKYMKGKQQIYGYVLPKEYVYDEDKSCYYKYETTKGGTSDKIT